MTDSKNINRQFLWELCSLLEKKPDIYELLSANVGGIISEFGSLSTHSFVLDVARMMHLEVGINGTLMQIKLAKAKLEEATGIKRETYNWKELLPTFTPTKANIGFGEDKCEFLFLIPIFYGLDATGKHNMLGLANMSRSRQELSEFLMANGIEINEMICFYKSTIGDINPSLMRSYPISELIEKINQKGSWANKKFEIYKAAESMRKAGIRAEENVYLFGTAIVFLITFFILFLVLDLGVLLTFFLTLPITGFFISFLQNPTTSSMLQNIRKPHFYGYTAMRQKFFEENQSQIDQ